MSWQIFVHSVRQVFGNLEGALRVSAVLTIAQMIITLAIGRFLFLDQAALQAQLMEDDFNAGLYLLTLFLMLFLGLWIAVGWHRYVLTNERPALVPKLYLDRILGYFGKSFLIGLLVMPAVFILGSIVGFALMPILGEQAVSNPVLFTALTGALVYIPVGVIAMRLSACLPGVALEPGVSVFAGWKATAGHTGTILGVVVISVIASLALTLPSASLFEPLSVPAIIWHFVAQWVQVMVGVSILTTLYGHFVEGRPLV